ncbi:MAG: hypothetical protein IJX22_00150, partial [Opitutales bacterium]|nr:hypothetical protein [Opitutales bacterium]
STKRANKITRLRSRPAWSAANPLPALSRRWRQRRFFFKEVLSIKYQASSAVLKFLPAAKILNKLSDALNLVLGTKKLAGGNVR